MLNSDDEQDNNNSKKVANQYNSVPSQNINEELMKESLGIKTTSVLPTS